jgi:hypothetical protein
VPSRHATVPFWAATNRSLFRKSGEQFERLDQDLHLSNIAFSGLTGRRDGIVLAGARPDSSGSKAPSCGLSKARVTT